MKLVGSGVIEELKATYSAKQKAELLLLNLEKLKAEISSLESRYSLLTAGYTKICDDAIAWVSDVRSTLEKDIENRVGDLQVFNPKISNLEARLMLGLVSSETCRRQKISKTAVSPAYFQPAVDRAASLIEFGLDRIGDGIIYMGEIIARIPSAILKALTRQQQRL
ncbi:MAG TPA: hypothetical protein EYP71_05280 [Dehalococcoidia bacterium]|nr:hypothetical protein [Dehalococcoidia bacterium]